MRPVFVEQGVLTADEADDFDDLDQIEPGLEPYWVGWHILRDDRHFGAMGGCSTIFYSAISRYAEDHGIDGTEFDIFLTLLRAMDAEYLLWMSEQKPKPNEGGAPT